MAQLNIISRFPYFFSYVEMLQVGSVITLDEIENVLKDYTNKKIVIDGCTMGLFTTTFDIIGDDM